MTSLVDIANEALLEVGNNVQINNFSDNTAAARAASVLTVPKLKMLARSANWDKFRAQIALTLLKATVINGSTSSNPPPSPWNFEYAYPSDCLRARFIQPTPQPVSGGVPLTTAPNAELVQTSLPTQIPFVIGTDTDTTGNPNSVILTNLCQAQLVYTRNLINSPDLWDDMFHAAATALLASYFINALQRDTAQMNSQIGLAKNIIEQARSVSANESISNVDHTPDWISARGTGSVGWAWNQGGPNGVNYAYWDSVQFPDGMFY